MPLPLAIGSLLLGGLQAGIGGMALNQLNQTPIPNFGITPEQQNSYGRAQTRAGYGYSPEQRADYMGNVAGRNAQVYNNAIKLSGGNLSGALARGIQSSALRDYSTFAANDAQLQQNNIRYADQRGDMITNQRNMATNQNIQNRIRQEQAFGGALQSGLNNIAGAANFFAMNGGFNQLGNGTNVSQPFDAAGQQAAIDDQFAQRAANSAMRDAELASGTNRWRSQNQAAMNGFQPQPNIYNQNLPISPGLGSQQMNPFGGYGLGGNLGGGIMPPANNWGANSSWLNPGN